MENNKISIEICLISARGLPRSSFWKHQWYAVGWIDPNNKYCTKIDASGNPNPVWKTKFTTAIDESNFQDLALHVEVYSREPLFLREKLQGTAIIMLKEFLVNHCKNSDASKVENGDVGSFQLRKKKNGRPQGFIDVSIGVSDEKDGRNSFSYLGHEEGFSLRDDSNGIILSTGAGQVQAYPAGPAKPPFRPLGNPPPPVFHPYTHPVPYPTNYSHPSVGEPSYPPACNLTYPPTGHPPPPPLAPPPPYAGYTPTFPPPPYSQSSSYMNLPSSAAGAGRGGGPGFGVGLGAGALAAGAVIYSGDFMSGFELPAGIQDSSLTISIDPPF